jgi:hypothetical protein
MDRKATRMIVDHPREHERVHSQRRMAAIAQRSTLASMSVAITVSLKLDERQRRKAWRPASSAQTPEPISDDKSLTT